MIEKRSYGKLRKIYTKEEADKLGIKYVDWRKVEKVGDWVITDDDLVCECVSMFGKRGKLIRTPIGAAWTNASRTYGTLTRHKEKASTMSDPNDRKAFEKFLANMYAIMLIKTGRVDWDILELIAKPLSNKYYGKGVSVKRILSKETTLRMIGDKLKKMLSEMGIYETTPYEIMQDAIKIAKEKKDVNGLIKIMENLQELYGHKGDKLKTTETVQLDSSVFNALEESEKREKLTLQRVREEPLLDENTETKE